MKKILFSLIAISSLLAIQAAEPEWTTDFAAAKAKAKAEGKMVLMDFTGSDWCGWCIKLRKEVFLTPEFNAYARSNLVLVEIDQPRYKPLSPEMLETNTKLQEKYGANGFPTLVLLS